MKPIVVRTAMGHDRTHLSNRVGIHTLVASEFNDTCNAAHNVLITCCSDQRTTPASHKASVASEKVRSTSLSDDEACRLPSRSQHSKRSTCREADTRVSP